MTSHKCNNGKKKASKPSAIRRVGANVAWEEDFWVDGGLLGTIGYLSGERSDESPAILVPDGAGDYREHRPETRRRLGF